MTRGWQWGGHRCLIFFLPHHGHSHTLHLLLCGRITITLKKIMWSKKKCVCGWTNRRLITMQEFPIHFFCFKSFLQTSCCLCELFCMQCTRTLFVYSGRSMSIYIHVIINFVNNKQWQQHCMSFYMLYSLIKNSFEFFVVTVVITLRWTWSKDQLVYRLRK